MTADALYQIPLFEGISDDELRWLIANSQQVHLEKGDYFMKEGDLDVRFYIMLEGEMQVTRQFRGETIVMGTTPRGITGGQLNILNDTPAEQAMQAIMPCELMVFQPDQFRAIFTACPKVGSRILRIAAERMSMILSHAKQYEKMAALGKLSAGLAHELNNPASAALRAAESLKVMLPSLQVETIELNGYNLTSGQTDALLNLQQTLLSRERHAAILSPLERTDREDAIGNWLEDKGINNSWEIASVLVGEGYNVDELASIFEQVGAQIAPRVITWLAHTLTATELIGNVEHCAKRISDLVGAVKEYTYMDRAPIAEDVDLQRGIETTLKVLNHKLKNIEVVRDYDPTLPKITGSGSDLNQVWTNLIDNASDAMKGQGTLEIITRNENTFAMIEIADSGSGIPPEVMPHLFEPFYTTKDVGAGTGLGLDTCYRIIQQHNATIDVQSQPGRTRFIVRIPVASRQKSTAVTIDEIDN